MRLGVGIPSFQLQLLICARCTDVPLGRGVLQRDGRSDIAPKVARTMNENTVGITARRVDRGGCMALIRPFDVQRRREYDLLLHVRIRQAHRILAPPPPIAQPFVRILEAFPTARKICSEGKDPTIVAGACLVGHTSAILSTLCPLARILRQKECGLVDLCRDRLRVGFGRRHGRLCGRGGGRG